MLEKKQSKTFLCASAEWTQVVENATSFEEAASLALRQQVDCDSEKFSVGAVISVIPIEIFHDETKLIYSPSVLADIGMHNHAAEMVKQIEQDEDSN
jgi:hypothetical protein